MQQRLTVLLAPGVGRRPLRLVRRPLLVSTAAAHTATTATERLLCLFAQIVVAVCCPPVVCPLLHRRLASL